MDFLGNDNFDLILFLSFGILFDPICDIIDYFCSYFVSYYYKLVVYCEFRKKILNNFQYYIQRVYFH